MDKNMNYGLENDFGLKWIMDHVILDLRVFIWLTG